MKRSHSAIAADERRTLARSVSYWLCIALLVVVPLAFGTVFYQIFVTPKYALLLVGASILLPLLVSIASEDARRGESLPRLLKSRHVAIVSLYFLAVSTSTLFGVAPIASLFGSNYSHMGLITQLCFFACFVALIVAVGTSKARLLGALWAMSLVGCAVATYAVAQFFGRDPFLSSSLYTFDSATGFVVRPTGTLGHSNYLGNFLLYTTPLSAGLAFGASGRRRRLMVISTALSVAAIIFSGTRGAWVGLGVGAMAFVVLELFGRARSLIQTGKLRAVRATLLAALIASASILVIASIPASRNVLQRARSFITDGLTGSGRTLLWSASIRMVPAFALTGCGPEGFRKAFLAYKTKELAQLAPQTNNESSHNSYLDAAVSHGLPGLILYIAIIASAFALLVGARRRANNQSERVIIAGLISSFAAVAAHNFFIFDQIPTRLYFFAFVALAYAAANVMSARLAARCQAQGEQPSLPITNRLPRRAILVSSLTIPLLALFYAASLARADWEIKNAFAFAAEGDGGRVIEQGRRATARGIDPANDYDFLFARALTICAERLRIARTQPAEDEGAAEEKRLLVDLATQHAARSIEHTLTPDSSHLLLAYLALLGGDGSRLGESAAQAIKWDRFYPNARWLMAEAYLAQGDREQAAREAGLALEINPSSRQARRALARARAETGPAVEQLIERSRALMNEGKMRKARRVLLRAIRKSNGTCPDCRYLLASVYEATNLQEQAVAEWEAFMREVPERAETERIRLRIDSLRQKR